MHEKLYQETFNTWNNLANIYEDKFMDLDIYNSSYDLFSEYVNKPDAEILDAGCGPGNISRYLLSVNPGYKISGIDAAENMVELAKKNIPSGNFQVMDIRNILSLNKKFHGITCGFCIPFLDEVAVKKLISDFKFLLNQQGVLYLSFMDKDPSESGYKTGSTGDKTYFHYYRTESLVDYLENSGFRVKDKMDIEYNRGAEPEIHTVLIAVAA